MYVLKVKGLSLSSAYPKQTLWYTAAEMLPLDDYNPFISQIWGLLYMPWDLYLINLPLVIVYIHSCPEVCVSPVDACTIEVHRSKN